MALTITNPGEYNKVVTIQENTQAADGMGGFTDSWGTVTGLASLRVAIWPVSARERIENQQIEHVITHRVRCWYRSAILPAMRVKWGSRYFKINSIVNPEEDNRMLDMICEEVDE